ncbi:type II toxin-antitoxin system RelE/ParE family toxin [Sphingomonas aliaeris]|uniref:Type II toxin-antitoxin system RelE/ParE family toxin n=1 Tax=Sphingomonas aliaeris TaxID=2759526 RepID=A0A974NTF5_9SPHN|nr:type II toxin-antitoxin system RelE/ParE family toxin [Sphingomonas aliaeris]QQV76604.1 type II toxin-antitoxin system RelE/ParE family toxin [Sphingomonas aliaeris]
MRLVPAARDDLRDIRIYSKAAFGAVAARAYLNGLRTVFDLLVDHPSVGIAERDLGEDIRSHGFRSHRVYYIAGPYGVRVIRILHHTRDVMLAIGGGA